MKNRFKISLLIVATICLFTSTAFSQFSRNQAIDLVLNTILSGETGTVNVHASYNVILDTEQIDKDDYISSLTCPYPSNWVFFVDDVPTAKWIHPCRYIFVNSSNGDYQILNEQMYPVRLVSDYELISHIPVPQNTPADFTGQEFTDTEPPHENLYAVLITGYDTKEQWKDICTIYNTLINVYGYTKEHIYVHYRFGYSTSTPYGNDFDDDQIDDIDYSAHHYLVHETFQYLSGDLTGNDDIPELQHGDQLFVWLGGHGNGDFNGASYVYIPGEVLTDEQLASWSSGINCSQMVYYITPCLSGGFIDNLSEITTADCKNREVHAACDYDEFSVSEVWVTYDGTAPPNLNTVNFQENTLYWNSAARGYFPDFDQPWLNIEEYTVGEFPLENYVPNHTGNWDPDTDGDGYVTMGEAFEYSNWMDTWTPYGVFEPWDDDPDYVYNPPPPFYDINFIEDILTLNGLAGPVSSNQTITGNFLISKNVTIKNSGLINFSNSSEFYLQDGNSRIYVDGELNIGESALLKGQDDTFLSLLRTNTNGVLTIGSGTEFNKIRIELTGYPLMDYLLMDHLIFNNFDINGQVVSLDVLDTDFNNGWMQIMNCDDFYMNTCNFNYSNLIVGGNSFTTEKSMAIINDCIFDHYYASSDAIWIEQMPKYRFAGNNIQGYSTGLQVFNSGEAKIASIYDNFIHNNNTNGVGIYNSHAYFRMNNIRDNQEDGISLLNSSYVMLSGNQSAKYVSETQRFRDNGMYEVFTDGGSFPEEFKWNAIIDEDNNFYELVYCESEQSEERDVRYNYWGSEETFDPNEDLFPAGDYSWFPKFKLEDDEDDSGIAETMFYSAENDFELENYSAAKNGYQQVVEQYPENKFAKASIKQLFSVEEYVTNDYNSLRQYFRTNNIILSNPDLEKLAEFFANKCDIKLENWQVAIDWFEYKIQNPESFADSLYAIIDLGNTYLLMEQSGYKSGYSGNMIEHIPTSTEQYNIKRDFLISLLPQDNLSKTMKDNLSRLNEGELLQNVPNPFKGSTQIWYKLNTESNVQINVYNYTGQLIKSINEGTKTNGTHHIDFNANGLKNGIYFYSISINGQTTDSKKMTVME